MNSRALALSLLLAGCSSSGEPARPVDHAGADAGAPDADVAGPLEAAASPSPNLQWKRYAAFEADLAQALELEPDALCTEFGVQACTRVVHLAPLGGHEPFKTGLLEPSAEPLATTPSVVDRVVLSACSKRAGLDRAAGDKALVFRGLEPGKAAPLPGTPQNRALVTELYRRFLARDPDAFELARVGTLAHDDSGKAVQGDTFATLACLSVATSTEFLFF
jgi:hypothetical protein